MRKNINQLIVLDEYGGVTARTTDKYPSLEELQKLVDGYIEVVRLNLHGNSFLMTVDEDGVFNGKIFNHRASELYGSQIFGPAVKLKDEGEEMAAFISDEIPYIVNYIMVSPYFGENETVVII